METIILNISGLEELILTSNLLHFQNNTRILILKNWDHISILVHILEYKIWWVEVYESKLTSGKVVKDFCFKFIVSMGICFEIKKNIWASI
jgi:hypothetical protein